MNINEALVVVNSILAEKNLSNIQEKIFIESWDGHTYQEIAEMHGYDFDYVREVGAQLWQLLSRTLEKKVAKSNFKAVLASQFRERMNAHDIFHLPKYHEHSISTQQHVHSHIVTPQVSQLNVRYECLLQQSWEEAPDISFFLGRNEELATLKSWVVQHRCRLVGIFGIGGIGKSLLTVKLANKVQDDFDYILWKSLSHAPPLSQLLTQVIQLISDHQCQEQSLIQDSENIIESVIQYFKQKRCLLVLDNIEAILQSGDFYGRYRQEYQNYREFFKLVGECDHQSCLLISGREKPRECSILEGENLPIRSYHLTGLQAESCKELVQLKGQFFADEKTWLYLSSLYSGNPLALKIVATAIQDLFHGQVEDFTKEGFVLCSDLENLLNEHINRLSYFEQQVICKLAFELKPVKIEFLQLGSFTNISKRQLLEILKSLVRRSLVHTTEVGFSLQTIVKEYLMENLLRENQPPENSSGLTFCDGLAGAFEQKVTVLE